MRVWLIALFAWLQLGAAPASDEPAVADVSLIAIIANPQAYDGKRIETQGYLNLEYEGDALYVGKQDFDAFLTRNAIWFDGPKFENMKARRALGRHYVRASGVFHAHSKSHLGAYSGTLTVESVQTTPSRRQLSFLYDLSPAPLPWPLIIGALLVFVAFAAFRPLRAGKALVAAIAVFTVLRVAGDSHLLWGAIQVDGPFDGWFYFSVLEIVVGLPALIAMGWALKTGRWALCVSFMLLQLAIPAARELSRIDTWNSQMTFPFAPSSEEQAWSRTP